MMGICAVFSYTVLAVMYKAEIIKNCNVKFDSALKYNENPISI